MTDSEVALVVYNCRLKSQEYIKELASLYEKGIENYSEESIKAVDKIKEIDCFIDYLINDYETIVDSDGNVQLRFYSIPDYKFDTYKTAIYRRHNIDQVPFMSQSNTKVTVIVNNPTVVSNGASFNLPAGSANTVLFTNAQGQTVWVSIDQIGGSFEDLYNIQQ